MKGAGSMSASIISVAVLVAFSFGGFLHSAIQHDHGARSHGHEHSYGPGHEQPNDESVVWISLHAATRHEDKDVMAVYALAAILVLILVQSASSAMRLPLRELHATADFFERGRWLMRGIAPYRRFA